MVAGEMNSRFRFRFKGQLIAKRHRMKQSFQVMEPVRTPPQNIEQQVDLAGRGSNQRHKKALQQNLQEREMRLKGATHPRVTLDHQSMTRKRLPGITGATSDASKPRELSVAVTVDLPRAPGLKLSGYTL